ncbi:MAG: phosphatidylglycerophosphatase A [Burkholderia sp.]|nr:phosphatidylglycerophosphatase A [Burkholderia sp.]
MDNNSIYINHNNQKRATLKFMLSHPAHIISLGFGIGLMPFMSGTFGTIFGWLIFVILNHYFFLTKLEWFSLILFAFISGIYITGFTAKEICIADPDSVIFDEIVSIWIVLLFITPETFSSQFSGFLLFRFFDIIKPSPISYFDRNMKNGFGIMFDDILSAFMAMFILAFLRLFLGYTIH